jgi:hypothetical protein
MADTNKIRIPAYDDVSISVDEFTATLNFGRSNTECEIEFSAFGVIIRYSDNDSHRQFEGGYLETFAKFAKWYEAVGSVCENCSYQITDATYCAADSSVCSHCFAAKLAAQDAQKFLAIISYGNWKRQMFENQRRFGVEAAAKLWLMTEIDSGDYVCPQGEVRDPQGNLLFTYNGAEAEREAA